MAGFGFGNFIKPQATSVRPGDMPTFKDLSMQEKLMMLGATMRGDMQGAQQIPMLAAARARQAQQMGLDREFSRYLSGDGIPTLSKTERPAISEAPEPQQDPTASAAASVAANLGGLEGVPIKRDRVNVDVPSFDVESGQRRQGPPTLRDALPLLMKRRAAGMDIKGDVDLLDKIGPKSVVVNGRVLDERDPGVYGNFYGDAPTKGAEPIYDRQGREVGWKMADGAIQSIEAATSAGERAKARYDLTEIENDDGSKTKRPRLGVVEGFEGVPMLGGQGGSPGRPGVTTNRSQTPAAAAIAKGRADAQVERETAAPKAYSGLEAQRRTTDLVLEKLNQALGERLDPKTKAYVSEGGGQIGGGSAGLADLTKLVPGTPARDLDATLDTIRAAIGFDKLQEMRANSPTGGALGAISDKENKLLQSVMGSLDQGQSPDQLKANLKRLRDELATVREERQRSYGRQYNGASATAGASATPRITPEQARAELARRRAAKGGQ